MNVAGRVSILTGATGGIGAAVARALAARRAHLVVAGRDADRLDRLVEVLRGLGATAHAFVGDLRDDEFAPRLVEFATQAEGRVDAVVNCAGVQHFGFSVDETRRSTAELLQVNTVAPIALVNAALPGMIARGDGHIVNVGSIYGSIGFPCFATYSASKFALRGYSEALRRELSGTGVRVSYVAPRYTRTSFNRDVVAEMAKSLRMNEDDPETVARHVLDAFERRGRNRYVGWPERLFVRINSIMPRIVDGALGRQVERMRPFAERAREASSSS